ncbi:30S ribosomal protein S3 [Rhodobacter capsulatus YW2]|nr:30S ribosomal protein S3 [Rhodobacter capsulatus YW2]
MAKKSKTYELKSQSDRTWDSRWFAESKDYGNLLLEDMRMREFIHEEAKQAGIARVIIERPHKKCRVTIHAARPGVIIGKKGADIETLRKKLASFTASELHLNIVEVRKPELEAQLVSESICQQLERRVSFRRAMKRAVQNAMRMGALGIQVEVSGRLGGAEIARTEWYREGRVPLHTLRADIDYAQDEAMTPYGIIGVKVWIFKGEIMEHDPRARDRKAQDLAIDMHAQGSMVSTTSQDNIAPSSSIELQLDSEKEIREIRSNISLALAERSIQPGHRLGLDELLEFSRIRSPNNSFLAAVIQLCSSGRPSLRLIGFSSSNSSPMSDFEFWDSLRGAGKKTEDIAIFFEYWPSP